MFSCISSSPVAPWYCTLTKSLVKGPPEDNPMFWSCPIAVSGDALYGGCTDDVIAPSPWMDPYPTCLGPPSNTDVEPPLPGVVPSFALFSCFARSSAFCLAFRAFRSDSNISTKKTSRYLRALYHLHYETPVGTLGHYPLCRSGRISSSSALISSSYGLSPPSHLLSWPQT